jgi:triosephosphate isomerase
MRKKIVAGNWKMNNDINQTIALLDELIAKKPETTLAKLVVAPSFINLTTAVAKQTVQV